MGDILFLLDRVAERQPVGGNPVTEAEPDFAAARNVETGTFPIEHGDDLGGRVRLDRIINLGERQIMAQHVIGPPDHVEIDDEARGLGGVLGKKPGNSLAHDRGHPSCEAANRNRCRTTPETSPGIPTDAASARPKAEPKLMPIRPYRGRSAEILRISLNYSDR